MPMLRVDAQERLYDREAVLGRDARSVFPSLNAAASTPVLPRFVKESDLIAANAPSEPEDGSTKPLWAVLAANKVLDFLTVSLAPPHSYLNRKKLTQSSKTSGGS